MALFGAANGCAILEMSEDAARLYPIVVEHVEEIPIGIFDAVLAQRIAAMTAAAAGHSEESQVHFEVALEQAQAFPNHLERPQVLHWYAKMLIDRGDDRERAETMLVQAIDGHKAYGMPVHEGTAATLL